MTSLIFSFVCCSFVMECQGEIVGTYVDHVKNICHLELANPFTKCTLLVIW